MNRIVSFLALIILSDSCLGNDLLLEYVSRPEPSYNYNLLRSIAGPGYKAHVLGMTSVNWLTTKEVDRTQWHHWLTVVIPDQLTCSTGLLWINGGSNEDPAPTVADPVEVLFALVTGSVVADLRMVPNQPLVFADEGRPRYEDAIIAYTFDKYLATLDANWPLLFPMTKAAVLAMDTVQSFVFARAGRVVERFVVSGASKRGWTTWLTAAVDSRVSAIAPLVIDVLNMSRQMKHHYSAYGFFSEAIADYQRMQVFCRLDSPQGRQLGMLVDPYAYRDRFSMPKLLINSSGDQFFLPDAVRFYITDLPGQTYLRYCPNTDHGLEGPDAVEALLGFYRAQVAGIAMPQFSWSVDQQDRIIVRTYTKPSQVRLWQAANTKARDFRLQTIGKAWTSSIVQPSEPNLYVAAVDRPQAGWRAFFVELAFDSPFAGPIRLTTAIHVVPQCLPYAYRLGLDEDWDVDAMDVAIMAEQWLTNGPTADIAPACGDGWVDLQDYSLLASQAGLGICP